MLEPVAYLLTWTCYGTWLHGDPRGSIAPGFNTPGTETIPPNPLRACFESNRMDSPPFQLDSAARQVVKRVLADHAARRGWELLAVNVRTTHVHALVGYHEARPEKMIAEFKAWSTRRLREVGLVGAGVPVWTRHGSTRYLWEPASLNAAAAYVLEGQDVAH